MILNHDISLGTIGVEFSGSEQLFITVKIKKKGNLLKYNYFLLSLTDKYPSVGTFNYVRDNLKIMVYLLKLVCNNTLDKKKLKQFLEDKQF